MKPMFAHLLSTSGYSVQVVGDATRSGVLVLAAQNARSQRDRRPPQCWLRRSAMSSSLRGRPPLRSVVATGLRQSALVEPSRLPVLTLLIQSQCRGNILRTTARASSVSVGLPQPACSGCQVASSPRMRGPTLWFRCGQNGCAPALRRSPRVGTLVPGPHDPPVSLHPGSVECSSR